jgi:hypothetical protein
VYFRVLWRQRLVYLNVAFLPYWSSVPGHTDCCPASPEHTDCCPLSFSILTSAHGPWAYWLCEDNSLRSVCSSKDCEDKVHTFPTSVKCEQPHAPTVLSPGKRRAGCACTDGTWRTHRFTRFEMSTERQPLSSQPVILYYLCNGWKIRGYVYVFLKLSRGAVQWQSTWGRSTVSPVRGNSGQ